LAHLNLFLPLASLSAWYNNIIYCQIFAAVQNLDTVVIKTTKIKMAMTIYQHNSPK
jgi:ribosomal protein L18